MDLCSTKTLGCPTIRLNLLGYKLHLEYEVGLAPSQHKGGNSYYVVKPLVHYWQAQDRLAIG